MEKINFSTLPQIVFDYWFKKNIKMFKNREAVENAFDQLRKEAIHEYVGYEYEYEYVEDFQYEIDDNEDEINRTAEKWFEEDYGITLDEALDVFEIK